MTSARTRICINARTTRHQNRRSRRSRRSRRIRSRRSRRRRRDFKDENLKREADSKVMYLYLQIFNVPADR